MSYALDPVYRRWALEARIWKNAPSRLLGRYCWNDGTEAEIPIRTFRTRAEARAAKARLGSYRTEARVVRVFVSVRAETP